jgi:hypothetical protein
LVSSECTALSAALGNVQTLVPKKPDALQDSLKNRPELMEIFDTWLTGCVLVFSILDREVQKLNARPDSVGTRIELLWNVDRMKELLEQIRGQQMPLNLLIQTFATVSIWHGSSAAY